MIGNTKPSTVRRRIVSATALSVAGRNAHCGEDIMECSDPKLGPSVPVVRLVRLESRELQHSSKVFVECGDPKLGPSVPVVRLERLGSNELSQWSGSNWHTLPADVVVQVLKYLSNSGVVSVGQTCFAWRSAAKMPFVWAHRSLSYRSHSRSWHTDAQHFARVIRFAPRLARVICHFGMKPAAKKAINTQSKCQVRCADLNGRLKWSSSYITRQRDNLEELSLVNPTEDVLKLTLELPHLKALTVLYKLAHPKWEKQFLNYDVPTLPDDSVGNGTVTKLQCGTYVALAAVNSLVRIHATSLEEVSAHCLPLAVSECASLRRLTVKLNPVKEVDQRNLRTALQGKKLETLAFKGGPSHVKNACQTFRQGLERDGVSKTPVTCDGCIAPRAPQWGVLPDYMYDPMDEYD
ncbi:uncharacterized protein LOC117654273 isoform X4 [Thrips palmi]|uniref:Uncharacterized protein LOC117654273 isoform X4 n=1 Tax=Thrips palmi TaxID=161013 RepID=A0A6P9AH02_THRPL|nr:uncharacterized protein LOC117654273 isoform X4 [Thrips palmi]